MVYALVAARNLAERHGVGRVAGEAPLVYVDARAQYHALQSATAYRRLDERSAELAVAVVDVVGPLQLHAVGIGIERPLQGQRFGHSQHKLVAYRHLHGAYLYREEQVLSLSVLPSVASLSASGGLVACCDHHHILVAPIGVQIGIGRIDGVQSYHSHITHLLSSNGLKASSVCITSQWRESMPTTVMMSNLTSASMPICLT